MIIKICYNDVDFHKPCEWNEAYGLIDLSQNTLLYTAGTDSRNSVIPMDINDIYGKQVCKLVYCLIIILCSLLVIIAKYLH